MRTSVSLLIASVVAGAVAAPLAQGHLQATASAANWPTGAEGGEGTLGISAPIVGAALPWLRADTSAADAAPVLELSAVASSRASAGAAPGLTSLLLATVAGLAAGLGGLVVLSMKGRPPVKAMAFAMSLAGGIMLAVAFNMLWPHNYRGAAGALPWFWAFVLFLIGVLLCLMLSYAADAGGRSFAPKASPCVCDWDALDSETSKSVEATVDDQDDPETGGDQSDDTEQSDGDTPFSAVGGQSAVGEGQSAVGEQGATAQGNVEVDSVGQDSLGEWHPAQAHNLGDFKKASPFLDKAPLLKGATSVSEASKELNSGRIMCPDGICIIFSEARNSYWLVYRDDKMREAFALLNIKAYEAPPVRGSFDFEHISSAKHLVQGSPTLPEVSPDENLSPTKTSAGPWSAKNSFIVLDVPERASAPWELVDILPKSDATSVEEAVGKLNSGALRSAKGIVQVYSSVEEQYVLIYREDRETEVKAFPRSSPLGATFVGPPAAATAAPGAPPVAPRPLSAALKEVAPRPKAKSSRPSKASAKPSVHEWSILTRRRDNYRGMALLLGTVTTRNFPEGILIALIAAADMPLALCLCAGAALVNVAEGMVVAVATYDTTGDKPRALRAPLYGSLACLLGALFAVVVLHDTASDALLGCVFAILAGAMCYVAVAEMLPKAFATGESMWATLGICAGLVMVVATHGALKAVFEERGSGLSPF